MDDKKLGKSNIIGKEAILPNQKLYGDMYNSINVNNLFAHSDGFGYTIYEMYETYISDGMFEGLALLREDLKRYWGRMSCMTNICTVGEADDEFVIIDEVLLDELRKIKTNIYTYTIKRCLWPDDETITTHKRIEYELLARIIPALALSCKFEYQKDVMGYKADVLFKVSHKSIGDNLSIILEIDENGHRDRDPEYEKKRQAVCEFLSIGLFGWRRKGILRKGSWM